MVADAYYIVYDEFTISICSLMDDVCDALASGSTLYGYTDNEATAQLMMNECFKLVEKNDL